MVPAISVCKGLKTMETLNTFQNASYKILSWGILTSLACTACTTDVAEQVSQAKEKEQPTLQRELAQLNNALRGDLSQQDIERVFRAYIRGPQKEMSAALAQHVLKLSREHRISPSVILAVIRAESSFKVRARSHVGALGLMQVKPSTAKYIAEKKGGLDMYRTAKDLYNPFVNISVGVAYLAYLRDKFGNSLHYVAAYNLGPTTVKRMVAKNTFALGKVEKYVTEIHQEARGMRKRTNDSIVMSASN